MKTLLFLSLLLINGPLIAQVHKANVKDVTFLRAIDLFMDSLKISEKEQGVVTIEISELTNVRSREEVPDEKYGKVFKIKETLSYEIKASFELNLLHFEYNVPTFYFNHRNRIVLVYTGAEKFIVSSKKTIDGLRKMLRKSLPQNGTYL